jgi:hypothetical protein
MIIYCSIKLLVEIKWAVNSAGECHPHTVEVVGSNPTPPTIQHQGVMGMPINPFHFYQSHFIPIQGQPMATTSHQLSSTSLPFIFLHHANQNMNSCYSPCTVVD